MYTISKNAQIVIALLKKHNIKHIVISPGATNIPISQGVQDDQFFTCYSIVDERSAIYFAIGLYLKLGVPVATTCTSAQATRNYIPGLTEAFYKHIPILAITASKHPRYTYQEFMQAPDQTSLPQDAVKKSFALPHISDEHDKLHCIRLVNEAMLEITHRNPGPVQLNVPILDKEQINFTCNELPDIPKIERYMAWDNYDNELHLLKDKSIMIVIGEHRPFSKIQKEILEKFTECSNSIIYTNHLSNYYGKYSVSCNLELALMSETVFLEKYKPDILITIGGQTGDYPLFWKLSSGNRSDFEHWRISEDGNVVDTYDKLTKIFESPFENVFYKFNDLIYSNNHSYFDQWKELESSIKFKDELPFSNAYIAHKLHDKIPPNSYLHFSILNCLRVWSYFKIDNSIKCYSNVAAFGIDGCMSVFLGQSVASSELSFLVIGDLSFFYDMNSLGIRHLKNNIRILLINNGGGVEFKLSKMKTDPKDYISASGHYNSAKQWAESNSFKYIKADSKEKFGELQNEFIKNSEQAILFEIFINPENETEAHRMIFEQEANNNILRKTVKNMLGEKSINIIKNIIKQ